MRNTLPKLVAPRARNQQMNNRFDPTGVVPGSPWLFWCWSLGWLCLQITWKHMDQPTPWALRWKVGGAASGRSSNMISSFLHHQVASKQRGLFVDWKPQNVKDQALWWGAVTKDGRNLRQIYPQKKPLSGPKTCCWTRSYICRGLSSCEKWGLIICLVRARRPMGCRNPYKLICSQTQTTTLSKKNGKGNAFMLMFNLQLL